jgi:hypothetical protein
MKIVPTIFVAAAAIAAMAQSAHGWTFTWRDASGKPYVATGKLNAPCRPIKHARGQTFEWDRPGLTLGARCCIQLFDNAQCAGRPRGSSCGDWTRKSSANLAAFRVVRCSG